MELRKVTATARQETKKGAMRRLRASGQIPAIAYGKKVTPRAISVSPKDLESILVSDRGRNTVIELDVQGGDPLTVLLTEYQYHPVGRHLSDRVIVLLGHIHIAVVIDRHSPRIVKAGGASRASKASVAFHNAAAPMPLATDDSDQITNPSPAA